MKTFLKDDFLRLYDIVPPVTPGAEKLYCAGSDFDSDGKIIFQPEDFADFGTYFNSFSLKKWSACTFITDLKIFLELAGKFHVEIYCFSQAGEEIFFAGETDGNFSHEINFADLSGLAKKFDLLGVKVIAKSPGAKFLSGTYSGKFSALRDVKIGITICTFKREKYLQSNLDKFEKLIERNPNVSVMVIDNGQTLEEKNSGAIQIMHNKNFGGSGGFTRGLIEQVNRNKNTHVILSDDDTVTELSSFDRLYSFLRGLKPDYHENFFGGAMLRLDKKTEQFENTAYWKKIRLCAFGRGFDLTDKKILCKNEYPTKDINAYAAWWFCCMPLDEVRKNGYPIPVFIKGDDMEYGIRHGKDFLTMNGVGVWHETFANKDSFTTKFLNDRNMLIIQHLTKGYGKFEFVFTLIGRIGRRILKLDFDALRRFEFVLRDLENDFEGITEIPADEKFAQIKSYSSDKNIFAAIFSVTRLAFNHISNYDEHDRRLKNFIEEKLSDQKFWLEYLGISGK